MFAWGGGQFTPPLNYFLRYLKKNLSQDDQICPYWVNQTFLVCRTFFQVSSHNLFFQVQSVYNKFSELLSFFKQYIFFLELVLVQNVLLPAPPPLLFYTQIQSNQNAYYLQASFRHHDKFMGLWGGGAQRCRQNEIIFDDINI